MYIKKILIVLFGAVLLYNTFNSNDEIDDFNKNFISSNNEDDILYELYNNYLPDSMCNQIYNYIKKHPKGKKNNLSDSFKGSYGLSFSFKSKNIYEHLKKYNLEQLNDIILKLINDTMDDSNAYYFNILTIPTKKVSGLSADFHYDNTLTIEKDGKDILPRYVTVLYIHLPNNFDYGNLLINYNNENIKIKPKINRLIKFRGDTYHGVENICSINKDVRVSLVMEHYKLNNDELKQMKDFTIF